MNQPLHIFLSKYFGTPNKTTLIVLIFLTKVTFFLYFFPSEIAKPGMIGVAGGDTPSYFLPIENLIKSGEYVPDYRLPGYGSIYLLLRIFFDKIISYNVLIFLQWIVSTISVFYLAETVRHITNQKPLFYLILLLYVISTSTNVLDYFLLTESFTTSSLIFSSYFLTFFFTNRDRKYLFFSGLMVTWAVFMRPILLPILVLYALLVVLQQGFREAHELKKRIVEILILCSPFLIIDSAWTVRNYQRHNRFLPLNTTYYPLDLENTYYNELMGFVIAWGGDRSWWNPQAEIRWFIDNSALFGKYKEDLPRYIYTSAFSKDSLVRVKKLIQVINDSSMSEASRDAAVLIVKKNLKTFTESIRQEKPFLFYFESRIYLLKKFVVHSGTPWLFNTKYDNLTFLKKAMKLFYSIFYVINLALGCLGAILIVVKLPKLPTAMCIFSSISIYLLLVYPLLGHIEYRYLVPTYPFLLVCSCYVIFAASRKLNSSCIR